MVVNLAEHSSANVLTLKASPVGLPGDDQDLCRISPGSYPARYMGHRIVKVFGSIKVQAFFDVQMSECSSEVLPGWFKTAKCGERAYRPLSPRTTLGRCMDAAVGSWKATWRELENVRDLRVEVIDVVNDYTDTSLPERQRYSKVSRFWSVALLGEGGR